MADGGVVMADGAEVMADGAEVMADSVRVMARARRPGVRGRTSAARPSGYWRTGTGLPKFGYFNLNERLSMKLTKMFPALAAAALTAAASGPMQAQEERGPFPEGWQVRFDREGSSMEDLSFEVMPPGMHVTTGPAMIAYHPDSVATGDFRIESETFLFDPGRRREAFGFFIGGSDLQGPNQRYTYFLVREGGEFLVKTRSGSETGLVQDWTAHPAIVAYATKPADASTAKNVLVLEARGDRLSFSINGEEVWSGSRQGLETEGIFGLRVNHGLNIHVTTIMRSPAG